ncbi:hypothetical protein NEOLEDRAFT_191805 [Neolentinus lepideus HHB14362 ss-1]|uniref:Uncharacterized protein n=1 Tax=Neolentinus lepideus HHB14362 ss-1 TaxID=1314782 RepID=A0A165MGV4_9AGAM|nr:hypothetical protein NEOLEDRAFT_191805 [Neolentinus lepideus HHB14362 ss-1]
MACSDGESTVTVVRATSGTGPNTSASAPSRSGHRLPRHPRQIHSARGAPLPLLRPRPRARYVHPVLATIDTRSQRRPPGRLPHARDALLHRRRRRRTEPPRMPHPRRRRAHPRPATYPRDLPPPRGPHHLPLHGPDLDAVPRTNRPAHVVRRADTAQDRTSCGAGAGPAGSRVCPPVEYTV